MNQSENGKTPELLWRMAQQAGANPSLLAHSISAYGKQKGMQWREMAEKWRIQPEKLSRLALCRRPQPQQYDEDLARIAAYADVPRPVLQEVLQAVGLANGRSTPNRPHLWQRATDMMLQNRRAVISAVAAFVFLLVSAFVLAQPEQGTPATLVVFEGRASVVQRGAVPLVASGSVVDVAAGQMLAVRAGDKINLGQNDAAQLRLYDGSVVDLFDGTSLEITELLTNEKTYRVRLTLLAGRTLSSVSRALGAGDAFEIRTPSSTASVRGTVFRVNVITAEWTYVACDEGVVRVVMGDLMVELRAGEEVNAIVGRPLFVQPQNTPGELPAPIPAATADPTPEPSPTADETEAEAETTSDPSDNARGVNRTNPSVAPPILPDGAAPSESSGPPPLPTQVQPPPLPTQAQPPPPIVPTPSGPPANVPNPPPQVPGNPPGDTPGNPPGGGGVPPGHDGVPPGQNRP